MIAAVILTAFLAAEPPGDGVLFRSSFDAGRAGTPLAAPWKGVGGRFVIEGDAVRIKSDRSNPVLRLERDFEGDVTVEARVRDADRCHWTGLLIRGVYRVTVNKQFGTLSLVRQEGTKTRTLASVKSYGLYVHDIADFRMAVSVAGTRVRCALDGKTLIDVTDERAPASGGLAILGGWGTDVRYSDIVVRRGGHLAAPTEAPAIGSDLVAVADARWDKPDGIYGDGDRPTLTFTLRNRTAKRLDLRVRLRLIDYWEREVGRETRRVEIAPRGRSKQTWQPMPKGRGCFKVALDVAEAAGPFRHAADVSSFSVIPDPPAGPDAASPFGGHFERGDLTYHLGIGRRIGAKWVRFHDIIQWTWWLRVEPERGAFRWYDANVKTVRDHDFHILGEFLHTPAWATSAPKGTNLRGSHYAYSIYPPRSLDGFSAYVHRTVDHYKGRIEHWEVWNEPHYGGFWRGTPEQYAALCTAAYDAAKRADKGCVVVGGGGVSLDHLDWVERACKAGLADHLDAFSVHGLRGPTTIEEMKRQDAALDRLRGLLVRAAKKKGTRPLFPGTPVPIWNSETSFPSTSFLDQYRGAFREPHLRYHYRHAAEDMVRLYASNMAQGVERTFHYFTKRLPLSAHGKRPTDLDLLDAGGVLKPMGVAYATTARVLAGARFHQRLTLDGPVWCAIFQRGDDAVAVWWALSGGRSDDRTLPERQPPKGAVFVDLMGNERPAPAALPVSREPRFLVCPRTSAADLAHLLR